IILLLIAFATASKPSEENLATSQTTVAAEQFQPDILNEDYNSFAETIEKLQLAISKN
ncbi:hypothetical protein KQX54_018132, partial [Cotesia glomerata]